MALTSDFLQTSVVFLSAAVVAVPLAQRSGLGSVLGYLLAGVAHGDWGSLAMLTPSYTLPSLAWYCCCF